MLDSKKLGCAVALVVSGMTAAPAHAHFKLLTPDAWIEQADDGGPQKGGPCGPGGYDEGPPLGIAVTPTGKVTEYHAGDTVHVTWEVTVPHNGYYRIALAENRDDFTELPLNNGQCEVDMSSIQTGPHDNVLMDGIGADVNNATTVTMQDVVLPDEPCEKCTLQVTMFMSNHPPPCVYYHCADIRILPKAGSGTDAGMSSGGGTGGSGSGGATGGGSGGTTSGGSGGISGAAGANGGSGGSGAAGTTPTTAATGGSNASNGSGGMTALMGSGGAPSVPAEAAGSKNDDSGCSVGRRGSASEQSRVPTSLLGLSLVALYWRRRRQYR
jgi:hypothetical protein